MFRGEVPASEYQRMRAPFPAGDFPSPVKYGYPSVGRVEAGLTTSLGRVLFCLHPQQTRDKAFGPALGPCAAQETPGLVRRYGEGVAEAPSP